MATGAGTADLYGWQLTAQFGGLLSSPSPRTRTGQRRVTPALMHYHFTLASLEGGTGGQTTRTVVVTVLGAVEIAVVKDGVKVTVTLADPFRETLGNRTVTVPRAEVGRVFVTDAPATVILTFPVGAFVAAVLTVTVTVPATPRRTDDGARTSTVGEILQALRVDEVAVAELYPARRAVTRTWIFRPASFAASLYVDEVAPGIAAPSLSHR